VKHTVKQHGMHADVKKERCAGNQMKLAQFFSNIIMFMRPSKGSK